MKTYYLNTILEFGKYSGKTMKYIIEHDYKYVQWLSRMVFDKVKLSQECKDYIIETEVTFLLKISK